MQPAGGGIVSADRKVLLVEDEVLVAALAVDALEELGYQAIEATTARAALEIVSGTTPLAFAVIDVGLPDGRGDALALEMRRLRAGIPIIIATGYDGAQLDERLRGHPRTAVLGKPYDIAQLQAAIASIG
jgi:CheY-like chemotaxis protein